uniref:Uncharacterized protein n=2 Tax=Anoplophora glabripennis TaxID=217634 RepID=V5GU19_ANOGL
MKLWRISFKGKMRRLDAPDKLVNVDFQAEWRSNLPWFLAEVDVPIKILARTIAREPWTEELFQSLKEAHQTHYEQMGYLTGKLQIDDKVITLTEMDAFRDHSYGYKRDWSLMHRYIFHMFYLVDKTKISVGVICQPSTCTYLEVGFIVHPNGKMEAIDSCDLLLYQHGENGILNKELCFTFVANGTTYEVKVNYEHDVVHYVGNDIEAKMNERFLVCEVNGIPGRGLSEWHYNNVKQN